MSTRDSAPHGLPRLSATTSTFGGALEGKLRAMAAAGFGATEFWPKDLFEHPDGPDAAVAQLKSCGLGVSAYQALRNYEGAPPQERARKQGIALQMMDQMALLGADLLVVASNTAEDASPDRARMADDLACLGDLAAARGIRIAYEPIAWGRHVRSFEDGWAVVRAASHPQVGLLLDSFHTFILDSPLDALSDIDGAKIFLVELSDFARSALPLVEIARHYRLFPGEGLSDMREFVRRVRATGYAGCYSIEVFNAHCRACDPLQVARRAMDATRATLADVAPELFIP